MSYSMAHLLSKLRIDYSSLTMLHGMAQKPSQVTIDLHSKLVEGFKESHNPDYNIPDTELESLEEKTNRQLRLRELLVEHSMSASLIVMSLPMPRQVGLMEPIEKLSLIDLIRLFCRVPFPQRSTCPGWRCSPGICRHSCWFAAIKCPF